MRRFFPFLVLLFAATTLFAQQSTDYAPQASGDKVSQMTAKPAPKPGHPLDPDDVAVLTGKKDAENRRSYSTPQMYYSYPVGGSMFTQSTVGNAFMGDSGLGYGYGARSGYGLNTSSFSNTWFFGHRGIRKPGGGARFILGPGAPGLFHINRWTPGRLWFGPGSHFSGPTGFAFLPNLRP